MSSRRRFCKTLVAGMILPLSGRSIIPCSARPSLSRANMTKPRIQFRSVPVAWLERLRRDSEEILSSGMISNQDTFRSYLDGRRFSPPEEMPNARSVLIVSIPQKPVRMVFHWRGKQHEIDTPTGYTGGWFPLADLKRYLLDTVIGDPGINLVPAQLPLKLLAARTGLGQYGRNNILFVPGYGSFHSLVAFFCDRALPEGEWIKPLRPARLCKGCTICMKECPTRAIGEKQFPIDAGKCLTLYNELPEPIPGWINPRSHHALVGCVRCQFPCPINSERCDERLYLAEFNEKETQDLLNGDLNEEMEQRVKKKLERFALGSDLKHFSRNLKLVLL